MKRKTISFGLFALFSLFAFAAWAQDVTEKEIQETWVGKSVIGKLANGANFSLNLKADGVITIASDTVNDVGTWRLSENGYCNTWKTIRAGKERCLKVRRVEGGEMIIVNPDGSVAARVSEIR